MAFPKLLCPHWDTVFMVLRFVYGSSGAVYADSRRRYRIEASAPSPSFDRFIHFDTSRIRMVIEYAIYWDYDIQHVYDLEHVWIYVDHEGEIASCEASFHGRYSSACFRIAAIYRPNQTRQAIRSTRKACYDPHAGCFPPAPELWKAAANRKPALTEYWSRPCSAAS